MFTADIEKRYGDGTTISAAFDVDLAESRVSILFGPSGAGKTTLLRCIAGLETLTRGRIVFDGETWCDVLSGDWVPPQKRFIGYLFQDYALFPHLSVASNIEYGIRALGRSERRAAVGELSERLGIGSLLNRRPAELSGGQQQRVALARVLARRPKLLLLDEPFAALDEGTRDDIRGYLSRLLSDLGIPAIVVTHDWVDALAMGDRMVVIDKGKKLQEGPPREVLTRPAAAEVAAVVGVETLEQGSAKSRDAGTLTLAVGTTELVAVAPDSESQDFWVCIRGEDVTLEAGPETPSSARNRLRGTVIELVPKGPLTKVILDVGFPLVALVTRQSEADLGLAAGHTIYAVFKASIVHLIPRR
jgi:molybdate transport system ATP-binding protein